MSERTKIVYCIVQISATTSRTSGTLTAVSIREIVDSSRTAQRQPSCSEKDQGDTVSDARIVIATMDFDISSSWHLCSCIPFFLFSSLVASSVASRNLLRSSASNSSPIFYSLLRLSSCSHGRSCHWYCIRSSLQNRTRR